MGVVVNDISTRNSKYGYGYGYPYKGNGHKSPRLESRMQSGSSKATMETSTATLPPPEEADRPWR
jgi:hypothetical protein